MLFVTESAEFSATQHISGMYTLQCRPDGLIHCFLFSDYKIVRCGLEASSSRQPPGKTTKSSLNM